MADNPTFANERGSAGAQLKDNGRTPDVKPTAFLPVGRGLSSLRRQVTIAGLAMVILVLATAIVVLLTLRAQTTRAAMRNLAAVSHITAERTAQTFSASDLLVRSLQDLVTKQPLTDMEALRQRAATPAFHASLLSLQNLLPQISVAAVIAADGQLLGTSERYPAPPINIRDTPFFKALSATPNSGFNMSDPIYDPDNKRWAVYLGRPIVDVEGRFVGIALVGILAEYFEGYFSTIESGPNVALTLVNDRSIVIARWPRNEGLIGKSVAGTNTGRLPAIGDTAMITVYGSPERGPTRHVAVTRLKAQDMMLYLSVSQTKAAMLAPWRSAIVWVALFMTITLLGLALLALFVLRAVREEELWRAAVLERETRLSNQALDLAAARDAAEMANRVRGEFLANMSHELRTPLNAVIGFAELLEKEPFGPLGDPRYREFVRDIHGSGKHLLDIIGNILDLTKIDAGKLQLDEQEVDSLEIMQVCTRLMSEAAHAAGVSLEVQLPRQAAILLADPTRLRQILLNLLSNAIKFTPQGRVTLSGGIVDRAFVITVADSGIGMTATEAEQAMQPFRQIDSSLSRRFQGTGLGLPLTKSLVELHGGEMAIESAPGAGTTVRVVLPKWRVLRTVQTAA